MIEKNVFTSGLILSLLLGLLSANSHAGSTLVTDANGAQELWTFQEILGSQKLTSKINQSDFKGITQTWDANGNQLSRTDAEGQKTAYTYNATNQKLSMTQAADTALARTTLYEYVSADLDLITKITEPSIISGQVKETITTYDANLNISSITNNGFEPDGTSISRTTGYTYNANGQVIEIDGPRTDVNDKSTITYNECTSGGECGQIVSIENALGQTITFDLYDANGRLLQQTDANGTVTDYTYHPRGWLLTQIQTDTNGASRVTTNEYDNAGQLSKTILPDGSEQNYVYDAAHDLREITDNLGNKIEYTYDTRGNRTDELIKDLDGTLVRSTITAFDMRNFVESINNAGSVTQLINDAVGNVSVQTDPNLNPTTDHSYDALNRLNNIVDALTNTTDYQYNVADQLIQVNAPNGATTDYQYDDLGNLVKEISADRGTIVYTHDTAGNVLTSTDARSISASYQYDALNRLTSVTYPTSGENIAYIYDTDCQYGIGRLCEVQDDSGINKYQYDAWGNITRSEKEELDDADITIGTYITDYQYDQGNRVEQITYPGGRVVDFARDVVGRVMGVTSTDSYGEVEPIITSRSYRADGYWTEQEYGNGLIQTRDYDQQGRLTSHVAGDYTRDYDFDYNGNILNANAQDNSYNVDYLYDALDRLTDEDDTVNSFIRGFGYDENGNREQLTENAQISTLNYTANSNRLEAIDGNTISLDASGHTLSDDMGRGYVYNDAGRLRDLSVNGQLEGRYTYNSQQLRTRKVTGGETTVFHYNLSGDLIAESDGLGNTLEEYVYADGERVAVFVNTVAPPPDGNVSFSCGASASQSATASELINFAKEIESEALAATSTPIQIKKEKDKKKKSNDITANTSTPIQLSANTSTTFQISSEQLVMSAAAMIDQAKRILPTLYYYLLLDDGFVFLEDIIYLDDDLNPTLETDQVSLVWNAVENAEQYVVAVSSDPSNLGQGEGAGVTTYCTNDPMANINNLTPNETVYIRIWALVNGQWQYQDYVINRDQPVLYLINDHLGTPRQAMDDNQAIVWQWDGDGFGSTPPDEDVDGDSKATEINFRFPGQYFDQESGLFYNWNRYYDPTTGRYITSDPIGLKGGINTFGYVDANPLGWADINGLSKTGYRGTGGRWQPNKPRQSGRPPSMKPPYGKRPARPPNGNDRPESNLPDDPNRCNILGGGCYDNTCWYRCQKLGGICKEDDKYPGEEIISTDGRRGPPRGCTLIRCDWDRSSPN